jgi:predicted NBD/HSP70 family sugar kinase
MVLTRQPSREDASVRLLAAILRHGMRARAHKDDDEFEGLHPAEAAQDAGLSRPSVYHNISGWKGRILRDETRLAIKPGLGYAIGIDFGRLHDTRVRLVDIHGHEIETLPEGENQQRELPAQSSEDAIETAISDVKRLLKAHPEAKDKIVGVGVSLPGPVDDTDRPISDDAGQWRDEDAIPRLAERLGLDEETFVTGNDAYVSALAEHLWGEARSEHMVYVKWASSLRAALIVNGELYEGYSHTAGEMPHVAVTAGDLDAVGRSGAVEDLPTCSWSGCLQPGCVHALASIEHLGRVAANDERLRAARIVEAAQDRHEVMAELRLAARGIGLAVAPYVAALNPELVVLGGALGGRAYPFVSGDLERHLRPKTANADAVQVVGARLRNRTAVTGAAALALLERGPAYLDDLVR